MPKQPKHPKPGSTPVIVTLVSRESQASRASEITVAIEATEAAESPVYIRRCHVCNGVTESQETLVKRCSHCGKAIAPYYFFDEENVVAWSDVEVRPAPVPGSHGPIRGLSTLW